MFVLQLEGKDQEVSEVTVEQTETVEEKKEEVSWNQTFFHAQLN